MTATSESVSAATLVTADNFVRAETDMYFSREVGRGALGKFDHYREVMPIDSQTVVRANRDTLYSAAVVDLDAGPVTIALPDVGKRFRSLFVISEDHYVPRVVYAADTYSFSKDQLGTRYAMFGVRTLVNPGDPQDLQQAHASQDAIKVVQPRGPGKFEVPNWDPASQKKVREALLALASTLPDTNRMFGTKEQVDPVRHLIGSASAWGGNPEREATYLNVTPANNDGNAAYRLKVQDVPVDGFWSVSVYNAAGYYEPNKLNAYTINNITAKRETDGSILIQFGGCDGRIANCLPIVRGWNYMVRLYRPRPEILSGKWTFPEAQPLQ